MNIKFIEPYNLIHCIDDSNYYIWFDYMLNSFLIEKELIRKLISESRMWNDEIQFIAKSKYPNLYEIL